MRMRTRIQIRLNELGASVCVVLPRGCAGIALCEGAVPPASSMMLRAVVVMRMVMVGIVPAPAVRL